MSRPRSLLLTPSGPGLMTRAARCRLLPRLTVQLDRGVGLGRVTSRSSSSACPAAMSKAAARWRAEPEAMRTTNCPSTLGGSLTTRTRRSPSGSVQRAARSTETSTVFPVSLLATTGLAIGRETQNSPCPRWSGCRMQNSAWRRAIKPPEQPCGASRRLPAAQPHGRPQ